MTIQKCLFDALLSKCDADIKDSVARLHIYFNNSVGIGEHPQITEEMTTMTPYAMLQAGDSAQGDQGTARL